MLMRKWIFVYKKFATLALMSLCFVPAMNAIAQVETGIVDQRMAGDVDVHHIGDIEGDIETLRATLVDFMKRGILEVTDPSCLESLNPLDWIGKIRLRPNHYLVVAGDVGDPLKGPSSEVYMFINEMLRAQGKQVFTNPGNRELNKFRLLRELTVADFETLPRAREFGEWAAKKGIYPADKNDPATRLKFILETSMGAGSAFENHRNALAKRLTRQLNVAVEPTQIADGLVVATVMLDLMNVQELEAFYPRIYKKAQLELTGFSNGIHQLQMENLHPSPGAAREYLEKAQLMWMLRLPDVDLVFTHGSVNGKNFGAVPHGLLETDITFETSIDKWTPELNGLYDRHLKEAFDFSKYVGQEASDPGKFLVEYASYNLPLGSVVTTKSGTLEDSMIAHDEELVRKAEGLGRSTTFVAGHTPGRNAWVWISKGDGKLMSIMRLTNDSTGEGAPSLLTWKTRSGKTRVSFNAILRAGGGPWRRVKILDDAVLTRRSPPNEYEYIARRAVIDGLEYVVIGRDSETPVGQESQWILERIDAKNRFATTRRSVPDSAMKNAIKNSEPGSCPLLFH